MLFEEITCIYALIGLSLGPGLIRLCDSAGVGVDCGTAGYDSGRSLPEVWRSHSVEDLFFVDIGRGIVLARVVVIGCG